MNVLQILPSLDVGGVERGVIDLARGLKARGESIVVISSGGELVTELQKMGVPHYRLAVHKKSLFSLALIPRIVEVIQRERVDIVHARSRVPAWLGWLAARMAGIPFVTTCHGYYSTHLLSHIMGWGKRVIVISNVVGRHMIDDFRVSPERIRLVHRGVNLSQFQFRKPQREEERDWRSRPFRVVNVGRFSPIKGQVEFIKAAHILKQRCQHLEIWLVGSEEPGKSKYTESIKQTVRQLGMESCVKFLGTRRNVFDLIAEADLLVLSTLTPEAFGRVIIEAGAVGTPVVATRVGGVLDVINHGENGLLVPPHDVQAMAEAMYEIFKNGDRARSFAMNLRQKVEKKFTLDLMVDRTLEVYREIERQKKILIIKLGAVGDLILGVPSFRMMRQKFPEAFLSLLVDRELAPLISPCPYLNEVIPMDRKRLGRIPYMLKIAKKIRKEGFDFSVDLQNSKWTHLLCFLSGIGKRYGFRRGKFGSLLNRPDHSFDVVESPVRHQFRLLSKLGVRDLDERLELWCDPESEKRIEGILPLAEEDSLLRRVGIVLGSSPKWLTKRWPTDFFQQLSKLLIEGSNCRIVLIGSETDSNEAREFWKDEFLSAHSGRILNMTGKTSLRDLVSLVRRLDVLVTGDTAPLHFASAVHTKTVALFGPTDPRRHIPGNQEVVVLSRSLPCQPCYQGTCRYSEPLACLKHISVQEVFDAVQAQLGVVSSEIR